MMARALELVGERWSLLVVRDLLLGPRRFTDLARGLSDITPTRLTDRLRRLEAAGIVVRQRPTAGREVWYALTDAGTALQPVVEALILWGIENAFVPPDPDTPAHPEAVMLGSKVFLSRFGPPLDGEVVWVWRFPSHDSFTIRFEDGEWTLVRGEMDAADVVVEATPKAWAGFLAAVGSRRLPRGDIHLSGEPAAMKTFAHAFAGELQTSSD
jgi:DNA-binding HxlR family transcriptional regulator